MHAPPRTRLLISLFTLVSATAASSVALAEEPVEKSPAVVDDCRDLPEPATQIVQQPNIPLLAAGGGVLWFSYGSSVVGALATALNPEYQPAKALAKGPNGSHVSSGALGWLALPVAGPFLTAATLPKLNPQGPVDDRTFRTVMVVDGALQAAGVGLVVLSMVKSKPVRISKRRPAKDPCAKPLAHGAKPDAAKPPEDLRIVPVSLGLFFITAFHPVVDILAVSQSHDKARLWSLIPGPGPIISAATLNAKAIKEQPGEHDRVGYAAIGVVEMASLGLIASAPLWPRGAKASPSLPTVSVGAGSASLAWHF